uniref:Uncharacterized protein n=1 Tax=Rhodococcus hoagii TaxID=43767 RepID=A0A1Z1UZA3_RHOHA|nr:hypothetical protein pVAPN1572_0850 [Prescottella equi]
MSWASDCSLKIDPNRASDCFGFFPGIVLLSLRSALAWECGCFDLQWDGDDLPAVYIRVPAGKSSVMVQ